MNRLSQGQRTRVLAALVEGNSTCATVRIAGVAQHRQTLRVTPAMEAV